jgi:excisionase family DNA binding protein
MSARLASWSDLPDVLTVAEAAEFLRIPKNGIYEGIRLGILPAVNAGVRRTRIAKAALQQAFGMVGESGGKTAAFGRTPEAY